MGTQCPARHTAVVQPDGSVLVKFVGYHNHDVQSDYQINFVNALDVSAKLRNMVDQKLIAGVTNCGEICRSVRDSAIKRNPQNFEERRLSFLAHRITTKVNWTSSSIDY